MSVTSKLVVRHRIEDSGTVETANQGSATDLSVNKNYPDGNAAGEVNEGFADDHSIVGAGSKSYDLDAGTIIGLRNVAIGVLVKVVTISIKNKSAANALTLDGNFFGLTTDAVSIPKGGEFVINYGDDGETVTAATKDTITVNGTDVDYELRVDGRTA